MTYYLKYRPQSLDELDEDSVRITLQKIVVSKDLPHAFLFSGPKGTGKTSAARILAKIINCESDSKKLRGPELINPCNECNECKSITRGENMDVIELDAASHRGIEDIRQIRDAVKLSPAHAQKKIYIIDEAHMLTTEASNALLKTLEEPPSHVIFILATTNPEKLLDTIRSRVTNVVFKKATPEEIVRSLKKIADKEGIKIEESVLTLMAHSSDGSFRDASKVFEHIVTESSNDLTLAAVENLITNKKSFSVEEFLTLIKNKDAQKLMILLENAIEKGASAKDLTGTIIERLRYIMLSKIGINSEFKNEIELEDLIKLVRLFSDAYAKIPFSPIEQLPVEVAIVEWCGQGKSIAGSKSNTSNEDKSENEIIETEKIRVNKVDSVNEKKEEKLESKVIEKPVVKPVVKKVVGGTPMDQILWAQILGAIKPDHASTEALLRAAKPLDFDGTTLKLGVFYKFHKEHLESQAHRKVLEDALADKFGDSVRIVCTLTEPEPILNSVESSIAEITKGSVILTEINNKPNQTNMPLTDNQGGDIMSIAEKIFNQ